LFERLAIDWLTAANQKNELDNFRQRQLNALQMARTQPGFLANKRMAFLVYPDVAVGDASKIRDQQAAGPVSLTWCIPTAQRPGALQATGRLGVPP
jgi:hypothetical protein